jgi:hypothetical protein
VIRSKALKIKSIAQSIVCSVALAGLSNISSAQSSADLPMSTVEAISISGSQRSQINDFVAAWSERALGDNAQDTKRAIESLTKPLQERGVSVAFRQAYAQAITSLMTELDNKDTIGATLASLRLAGDLATPSAASKVRTSINSEDLGVQLFAVSRVGQIFTATKNFGPAMTPNDANSLINAIDEIASDTSTDPELLRACVRALSVGTGLSTKDMGDARSRSIIALANAVGPRLRELSVNMDPSYAQGLSVDAASAATTSISDIGSETTPEAIKAAVGLGGDIISISLRRVMGNTIDQVNDRDLTIKSIQAGEALLYFALREHAEINNKSAGSVLQTKFAAQLTEGNDRAFRNDASLLLGPGSDIVRMFEFADNRFVN